MASLTPPQAIFHIAVLDSSKEIALSVKEFGRAGGCVCRGGGGSNFTQYISNRCFHYILLPFYCVNLA